MPQPNNSARPSNRQRNNRSHNPRRALRANLAPSVLNSNSRQQSNNPQTPVAALPA
jgi:hypothetical protein